MITIKKLDNLEVISFTIYKINALITDEIRDGINKVFEKANSRVIIDLKGVEYIDSSGFGCFLAILKSARNNYGILKFANPEPRIKELFETLHLHTVFQIYDNMEDCIASFS